jgi:protein CrcB
VTGDDTARYIVVGVTRKQPLTVLREAARFARLFKAVLVCANVDAGSYVVAEHLDGSVESRLTGSFLLGLLTGLATSQLVPHQWQLIIGTGLIGDYTTFSTASFETVRLIEDRRYVAAAFNGVGMLLICTAAAALGFAAALRD